MASLVRSLRVRTIKSRIPSRSLTITSAVLRKNPATHSETSGSDSSKDLEVGELQGASFKVEPLRRKGEDERTMRGRLLCMFL
jgi:succinate dehydrogenase assembly factor 2